MTEEINPRDLLLQMLNDHRMEERIRAINSEERFSYETWDSASIEERQVILQEYMDALAPIFGLSDLTPLCFEVPTSDQNRYTANGTYSFSTGLIWINPNNLDSADSFYRFRTVRHELRHSYQDSAVSDPDNFIVAPPVREVWGNNFPPNYIAPGSTAHFNQPIETDAWAFGELREWQVRTDTGWSAIE